jgi:hypothetical protein
VLRPAPFLLGLAYAALGLGLSAFLVRETRGHAHHEATTTTNGPRGASVSTRHFVALVSYREPAISSAAQAGMVNNLNDGLTWGRFPLLFATAGLTLNHLPHPARRRHPRRRLRHPHRHRRHCALTAASGLLAWIRM